MQMQNKDLSLSVLRQHAEKIVHESEKDALASLEELSPEVTRKMLHELHVYQIELEMQNQELRKTEEALESQRRHYFELYDLAPVGYCTLSEQGLIVQANLTAAKLLGLTRNELIKHPISNFILKEDQDIYYFYRKQFFEAGWQPSCELRMLKHDGTEFWVHLSATMGQDAKRTPETHLILSDITKYKRLEDMLRLKEEKDGEKLIKSGDQDMTLGKQKIEQGNKDTVEGTAVMSESERLFKEKYPDLKLNLNQ